MRDSELCGGGLAAVVHVSFVSKSLSRSVRFYEDVLGFVLIKRPSSSNFEGLFNYGVGIHLLEMENVPSKKGKKINPKDNRISFQCYDMGRLVRKLEEMGIEYVTAVVEEGGVKVDQLFFHDPDGYMIEICNCENLPVLPLSSSSSSSSSSCPLKKHSRSPIPSPSLHGEKRRWGIQCAVEVANVMMDSFLQDMMDISIRRRHGSN